VFAHNDLDDLQHKLEWASGRTPQPRILIVTETVFSMDGDSAPLRDLVELKEKFGAWLMVDEAHATGLYGTQGRGLAEEQGMEERIEVRMGTLGKAIGASGGFICGSRQLIDLLIHSARSFIFSTAPVPAAAAAATAGIRFVQSEEGGRRRKALWERVGEFTARRPAPAKAIRSAILPQMIGDEEESVRMGQALRDRGFFLPAVRFPTVSRGHARLRLTLTAAHTHQDMAEIVAALEELMPERRIPRAPINQGVA
jgi:8-amino-7-oxononanoate synthase